MTVRVVPGVCSVTFRARTAEEVIALAASARLEAVEWGADVHAPPGDAKRAAELRSRCDDAGLLCPSYGSYHLAGHSSVGELEPIFETALALGASTIRVWAPGDPNDDASREPVIAALADACDRARAHGLTLALEYHPGTLTEDAASTATLLDRVGRPDLGCYWQPHPGPDTAVELAAMRDLSARIVHLHVFWWRADGTRRPLVDGAALWSETLATVARRPSDVDVCAYLEFVQDDDPVAFARDARTLRHWLGER